MEKEAHGSHNQDMDKEAHGSHNQDMDKEALGSHNPNTISRATVVTVDGQPPSNAKGKGYGHPQQWNNFGKGKKGQVANIADDPNAYTLNGIQTMLHRTNPTFGSRTASSGTMTTIK
eukprot:5002674-Amphidinium_carterae.1